MSCYLLHTQVWRSFGPRNALLCHGLQQFLVCLKESCSSNIYVYRSIYNSSQGRRKRKLEKGLFAATPIGANQKLLVKYFCSLASTLVGNLISHVWRGCHFRLPFKGFFPAFLAGVFRSLFLLPVDNYTHTHAQPQIGTIPVKLINLMGELKRELFAIEFYSSTLIH